VEPTEPRSSGALRVKTRVLLVDDERSLLDALTRALSREFDIVSAHGGRAAVDRILAGEKFDVIVCDVMMPDLSGIDVFERARAVSSETAARIVFITGGVVVPFMRAFLDRVTNPCLEKPIDLDALRVLLRERAVQSRA
jgi:DNA-binding response OmpR family regulator